MRPRARLQLPVCSRREARLLWGSATRQQEDGSTSLPAASLQRVRAVAGRGRSEHGKPHSTSGALASTGVTRGPSTAHHTVQGDTQARQNHLPRHFSVGTPDLPCHPCFPINVLQACEECALAS